MIAIQHILCPIDFSETSRRALEYAVAVARHFGSTITVFNVCPLVPATAYAPGTPMLPVTVPTPDDLQALLSSMQRFVGTETAALASIRFEIGEGNAASEIIDRAHAIPSDLIVMGTHGRSGVDRLLLGSVTERVVRKAPCPVLTVSPPAGEAAAPDRLFSRILCAIDFSDASLRAFEYALALVQDADARVKLVHVVEVTPAPKSDTEEIEIRTLDAYVAAAVEARAKQLEGLIPDNLEGRCTVDTLVAIGKSHREILRIAAESDSDLIVLGAHGLGLPQLLFGSTAQQVVRQARCPVLTIH